MKFISRSVVVTSVMISALSSAEPEDWRHQLLSETGMSLKEAEENLLNSAEAMGEEKFRKLVRSLGSEDFATRVRTQKQIEALGAVALDLIRQLPETDDPEINFRLGQIMSKLATNRHWTKGYLLRHAVSTLSREAKGEETPEMNSRVFAELFQDKADPLVKKYRCFEFVRDEGLTGKVTNGELLLSGAHRQQGDQRLILECEDISEKEAFPDEFLLEVSARATPGGEGLFHIGVSVGNVRVLFHPGFRGGAFRHERVDDKEELTRNSDMGFTPKTEVMSTISLGVKKRPDGMVELKTIIHQKGAKEPFEWEIRIPLKEFGEITTVSLDRSGGSGGNAIFDDFVIELNPGD